MLKFCAQDIPNEPGVYIYRNEAGEIIYIGKAKSLRRRMSSYFQAGRRKHFDSKLRALVDSIADYEYHLVKSDSEAQVLEDHLIKQYKPRYNIDLRDDKRYYYIVLDRNQKFPFLQLVRLFKDDNRLYFGPFPGASTLRGFVERLSQFMGLRMCSYLDLNNSHSEHCLNIELGNCSAPCIDKISPEEYSEKIEKTIAILKGNSKDFCEYLQKSMGEEAARLDFEKASMTRDILKKIPDYCTNNQRSFRHWRLTSQQNAIDESLLELKEILGITTLPNHIECLDMSHLGGTMAVGSVVCFKNGKPSTKDYRRFKINSEEAVDDTRRMYEVLHRRYQRLIDEKRSLPDLIVVDGGKPQLNIAIKALQEMGIYGKLTLIGLAERFEEIFLPGEYYPIVLPFENGALKILRAIRDEAHRFAVGYNRLLRQKRITDSLLDEIPGVGNKRKLELLKIFGSVANIKKLTPEEVKEKLPSIGLNLASDIIDFLRNRK